MLEPNRATKPPDEGRFAPEGEWARIKILLAMSGLGQTTLALARAVHLLDRTPGVLIRRGSLWATVLVRKIARPGEMPVFYGKIAVFSLVVLTLLQIAGGCSGRGARIMFLRELSYGMATYGERM